MAKPQGRWTDAFLAFRLTLDPRKLWLAFRGLVLSAALVGLFLALVAWLYSAYSNSLPPENGWLTAWGNGRLVDGAGLFAAWLVTSPPCVATLWPLAAVALLLVVIWCYYGAAIVRLMVVEYALGERIEVVSATDFARRNHGAFCGTTLTLPAIAALLALGIAFVGLVASNVLSAVVVCVGVLASGVGASLAADRTHSRWAGACTGVLGVAASGTAALLLARWGVRVPYVGEVVAALLSPLAVVAGLLVVVFLLWTVLGAPTMFGTLCSSDGDVFQAWSRSFHYLFVRPWLFLWLCAVLAMYGGACLAFVWMLRVGTEWAVVSALAGGSLGRYTAVLHPMGAHLLGAGGSGDSIMGVALSAHRVLLDLLVLSFWATFECAAMTILYFVLRRSVDGTPHDQVHLEPEDEQVLHPTPAAVSG
ncbi:hypothetical protein HQ576_04350 [bacterium]|nr:hypothetical protein [bacterium]